jgi:hypothetical protein
LSNLKKDFIADTGIVSTFCAVFVSSLLCMSKANTDVFLSAKVRDNGEGILPDNLDRIAEPNWTTRNSDQRCHSCDGGQENAATTEQSSLELPAGNLGREAPVHAHEIVKKRKVAASAKDLVEARKSRHVYGVAGEFLACLRHTGI